MVNRLQDRGVLEASEQWESLRALPLPAQFLNLSARRPARQEGGIRYRLSSLWPIYERNAPASPQEREGLEAVVKQPTVPHQSDIEAGGRRFFQAIYADRAVSHACVACHNSHPHSPRRGFTLQDVMGDLVMTIPLGR